MPGFFNCIPQNSDYHANESALVGGFGEGLMMDYSFQRRCGMRAFRSVMVKGPWNQVEKSPEGKYKGRRAPGHYGKTGPF